MPLKTLSVPTVAGRTAEQVSGELERALQAVRSNFEEIAQRGVNSDELTSQTDEHFLPKRDDSVFLSENTNNLSVTAARSAFFIESGVAANLTGISGGKDTLILLLVNKGTKTVTLKHQDAGSFSENRFLFSRGVDLPLAADESVLLAYDSVVSRWRDVSSPPSSRFLATSLTPAQITADQNDYNPEGTSTYKSNFWRISSDALRAITGIANGIDGRLLWIANVGTFSIRFENQSGSSSAANRIITQTGTNVVIAPDGFLTLIYDATSQRWREVA